MGLGIEWEKDIVVTKVDNGFIVVYYVPFDDNGFKTTKKRQLIVEDRQKLLDLLNGIV